MSFLLNLFFKTKFLKLNTVRGMKNFAFIMKKIMCFDHVMEDVLVTYSRFIFVALDWNWKSRILKGVVVCL